ncbi:hypothetical protein WISP_23661 [Willisornis vidua]|uniref:Uncharacterized protein n=1 Tax=Willisornis vidua TaxID=1566151 RepID=A0ABQ9DME0_9PASS|nr:hypothetical protein WISP_23661 [Willisornis vidua]
MAETLEDRIDIEGFAMWVNPSSLRNRFFRKAEDYQKGLPNKAKHKPTTLKLRTLKELQKPEEEELMKTEGLDDPNPKSWGMEQEWDWGWTEKCVK